MCEMMERQIFLTSNVVFVQHLKICTLVHFMVHSPFGIGVLLW
jgi:hypothetical protein